MHDPDNRFTVNNKFVLMFKQVQGREEVRCPGIQNLACEDTSECEGDGVAMRHGAGKFISPVYSHRAETQESWQQAGRSTVPQREHESAQQVQQSEVRWRKHRGISYTS